MDYQIKTESAFYLLSVLSFDVGTTVTLYGAIEVTTNKDLWFVLSKDINFDTQLLPAGQATASVVAPFGMTGVILEDFDVRAHINSLMSDLRVNATARFTDSSLSGFVLKGAIVFDNGSPRLALVSLSPDQPLTITQFVNNLNVGNMIGGTFDWMTEMGNQFAFLSGDMYYLSLPPNAPGNYTFPYKDNDRQITFSPGYGIDATLQMFQRYNFKITLAVALADQSIGGQSTINLQGTLDKLDIFDFVVLNSLSLGISTQQGYLRIGANVTLLGKDIGYLEANYDTTNHGFGGEIDGGLLPSPINSIAFLWSKANGFRITSIGGLPQQFLDILALLNALNKLLSGGCQAILDKWLNGLSTSVTPALNGSPSKHGSTMNMTLKLTYAVTGFGNWLDGGDIYIPVSLEIPGSLAGLPEAIGKTILDNAVTIAKNILSNPTTYKAVAEFVALNYGKQALARMLCRALDTPELANNPDTAKDIANTDAPADTLEGAAELAAQLTRVALLDVPAIVGSLVSVLDKIADLIRDIAKGIGNLFHLRSEKSDAEDERDGYKDQINQQCQKAQDLLNGVITEGTACKASIQIKQFNLRLKEGNVYVATWSPAVRNLPQVTSPVVCTLRLLDKDKNTLWPVASDGSNPVYADQTPYSISMGANRAPVVYASIASSIFNLNLMDDDTKQQVQNAINQFGGIDNDLAQSWAGKLRGTLASIPNEITTPPVYATLGMFIGNSVIGVNTRISNN